MKLPGISIILFACLATACKGRLPMFQLVPSGQSQVQFENRIVENDSINPFDVTNMYNGAGVGIGDFNNDGLEDIYFAGNQVACQLYLRNASLCSKLLILTVSSVWIWALALGVETWP